MPDLVIDLIGLVTALFGGGVLLGLALGLGSSTARRASVGVYAGGKRLKLAFSTALHLRRRAAATAGSAGSTMPCIFLMMAGSYTPFTTHGARFGAIEPAA